MTDKRILVLGFGRMGLSHASLYNLFRSEAPRWICVYDPSKILNLAIRLTRKLHKLEAITRLDPARINDYESIFVCSPPLLHSRNLRDIAGFTGKVFVEKPGFITFEDLAGLEADKVYVGYVLRHAPAIERIQALIDRASLKSLEITLTTNASFGADADNWRDQAERGGGLLNEFGSHCVNLMLHLAQRSLMLAHVETTGPNEFHLTFTDQADAQFEVRLCANQSSVRKAVYTVAAELEDGEKIWTDLSSIKLEGGADEAQTAVTLFASGQLSSPAYLRGHEFSNQMAHFIASPDFGNSVEDSIQTDTFLREAHDFVNARR